MENNSFSETFSKNLAELLKNNNINQNTTPSTDNTDNNASDSKPTETLPDVNNNKNDEKQEEVVKPNKTIVTKTAVPTNSEVKVDGVDAEFEAYNIDGYNYFTLRDSAYAINGSEKQFNTVWDSEKETLFGARDFFGIKPFYYTVADGNMIYGSEIKSILEHPAYKKEVNPVALENYLTFQYSVLDETFFKGIFKLMPGHCFTFHKGELNIERYWEPTFDADESKSLDEFVDEIDDVMHDSVEHHKISDVEVGSFLSSGVDSSYVAATFNGDKTFTVGFDYEKYNEIDYAKALSDKIKIDNYSKLVSSEEYWAAIPKIQYHMDEPLADPAAIALYFVSQTAAKHVKVAMSGEGADEFFGGYNIYREPLDLAEFQKLPKGLRKGLAGIANAIPFKFKGKSFLNRASKTVEERFIGNAFMFNEKERARILKNPTGKYDHKQLTKPFYDKVADKDDVTKMQYIDINFWLIGDILLKADKMSMAHSLEVRVPFLDKEVFNVARTIPTKYKVNKSNTKYAMRQAAHRHLPDMVAEKKKLGFPVPIRIWLKDEKYYNMIKKAFTSEAAEKYFNTDEIVKYLDDHKEGKADNSRKIWTIYMFLVWYEDFFGNGVKEAA